MTNADECEITFRAALVVVSDKAASGERQDACLPAMRTGLPPGCEITFERVIADDRRELISLLQHLADREGVDAVFTSGGTGLGPRDFTPQATLEVADYEVPGLGEAMRARSSETVPTAILSRAVSAVRGKTLIVNLPGNPKAVSETMAIVAPVLAHALGVLRGSVGEHTVSG